MNPKARTNPFLQALVRKKTPPVAQKYINKFHKSMTEEADDAFKDLEGIPRRWGSPEAKRRKKARDDFIRTLGDTILILNHGDPDTIEAIARHQDVLIGKEKAVLEYEEHRSTSNQPGQEQPGDPRDRDGAEETKGPQPVNQ